MRRLRLRGSAIVITLALVCAHGFRENPAMAQSAGGTDAKSWLNRAVTEKHCPLSPVNVPAALRQVSSDVLRQRITVLGVTLEIEGTPDPDHIVISAGGAPGVVNIAFNGRNLGSFGPIARILVHGNKGDDVILVKADVGLSARLEGGSDDDCVQDGSGGDVLLG